MSSSLGVPAPDLARSLSASTCSSFTAVGSSAGHGAGLPAQDSLDEKRQHPVFSDELKQSSSTTVNNHSTTALDELPVLRSPSKSSARTPVTARARRASAMARQGAPDRPLTEEERRMALMARNSRGKRSIVPILYFLAASLGKLILGFGVSLAIQGHYNHRKTDFGVGLGLAIAGFLAVVAAALGFGAAAARINRRMGLIFKTFSISGGCLIAIGYALKQYFVSDDKPLFSIRLAFIPLALGTACMGISLPNFTAYTELYRGHIYGIPVRHRSTLALCCLSPSMGALFAGWISSESGHWPAAFNAAVLTFVVALGYAGVALFWSDVVRLRAEECERRLEREEEAAEMHGRAGMFSLPNEKSGDEDRERRQRSTSPTIVEETVMV